MHLRIIDDKIFRITPLRKGLLPLSNSNYRENAYDYCLQGIEKR